MAKKWVESQKIPRGWTNRVPRGQKTNAATRWSGLSLFSPCDVCLWTFQQRPRSMSLWTTGAGTSANTITAPTRHHGIGSRSTAEIGLARRRCVVMKRRNGRPTMTLSTANPGQAMVIVAGTEFSCLLCAGHSQSAIDQKLHVACDAASRQWAADAGVEHSTTGGCFLVVPLHAGSSLAQCPARWDLQLPGSGLGAPANDRGQPALFLSATGGLSEPLVRVAGNGSNKI